MRQKVVEVVILKHKGHFERDQLIKLTYLSKTARNIQIILPLYYHYGVDIYHGPCSPRYSFWSLDNKKTLALVKVVESTKTG